MVGRHRDNVIVLYGQRRTGKTSILYQLQRQLGERYVCVFIDLHALALDGLGGAMWELATSITRSLRREHQIEVPRQERAAFVSGEVALSWAASLTRSPISVGMPWRLSERA